jgi:hypothetical protein
MDKLDLRFGAVGRMASSHPVVLQNHIMTDKWGRRFFTAGGAMLLLLGLVHSLSLIQDPVAANDTERQLLDLMVNYKFNIMGSLRSTTDMLRGFSISFMLSALGLGVLDLMLARERSALLKRVALINTILLAAMTANCLRYFFVAPTSFLAITTVIFALAWLKLPDDGVS